MRPLSHAGLKALSLVMAIFLWMFVAGEETVERGLRVPLELVQFPPGLELQDEAPTVVDVRVRGSSATLSQLGPGDIVAFLDLHTARAGRRVFQVTPEQVRVPFNVEVVQVSPASITLVFENSTTKTVPINPSYEGTPAPGYVVGKVTVQPGTVDVTGPESAVNRANEAVTEAVSVNGAREAVVENVTIGLLDAAIRLKTPRVATVRVETSEVVAFVDLAGLGPGDYPIEVRVDASADAGAARIEPSTVQVRIIRP